MNDCGKHGLGVCKQRLNWKDIQNPPKCSLMLFPSIHSTVVKGSSMRNQGGTSLMESWHAAYSLTWLKIRHVVEGVCLFVCFFLFMVCFFPRPQWAEEQSAAPSQRQRPCADLHRIPLSSIHVSHCNAVVNLSQTAPFSATFGKCHGYPLWMRDKSKTYRTKHLKRPRVLILSNSINRMAITPGSPNK